MFKTALIKNSGSYNETLSSRKAGSRVCGGKAFTLVEMLIAMTVTAVLMGLSASGYMGLRTTMILKQSAENLRSDIMYAKRSSMLVKRESSENFVKGVGVDLASLYGNEPAYRIFKWCSDTSSYEDYEERYLRVTVYGSPDDYYGDCKEVGTSQLASIPGYSYLTPLAEGLDFRISPNNLIRFIFFESPTGEMYMYDCNGNELEIDQSVRLIYNVGSRSYEVEITINGEVNVASYDGEVPETDVCNGAIDIFE